MNRKQRRKLDRLIETKGFGKVIDAVSKSQTFVDGDKVILRYNKIVNREDYTYKTDAYRAFVELNKDRVFTVHRVNMMREHSLIEFVEDESSPKWLWCDVDLRRAADGDKTQVL